MPLCERFAQPELTDKPMLFEVFTTTENESEALKEVKHFIVDRKDYAIRTLKDVTKHILPSGAIAGIKKIIK